MKGNFMNTITIDKNELKKIIKETIKEDFKNNIIDFISTGENILEGHVLEAIETIGLSNAIDIGMQTGDIDKDEFIKDLKKKLTNLR
jgi:hypothetical protein